MLLRSLYEIYLKMLFAISSPENAKYLWDCDFGLVSGDFEVYKKEGKIKWSVLVNKVTGKTIPRNLSFQKMAENSPFVGDSALFNVIYEYLSSFVHSGSRHVFKAWKNERIGFELVNDQDEHILGFISILTSFICALLMQAMRQLKGVSRVSLWDMNLYCFAMRQVALDISTPKESEIAQLVEKMIARAGAFPNKVLPLDIDDPALK